MLGINKCIEKTTILKPQNAVSILNPDPKTVKTKGFPIDIPIAAGYLAQLM